MGFLSGIKHDSVSRMKSLTESVNSNKSKNYFKVNFSNNGHESVFMISDLKNFSEILSGVFKRYPELYLEKFDIHYCDEKNDKIPIANSDDFEIFMETFVDQNIYVSRVNENVMTENASNTPQKSKKEWIADLIVSLIVIFATLFLITEFVGFDGLFDRDSLPEQRSDQGTGYKEFLQEFCEQHPSSEKCQNVIVGFMSYLSQRLSGEITQ